MGRTVLFNRGIPTEPDVIALTKAFGVPAEGVPISYAEVAAAINVPERSTRFKTVTDAWRASLKSAHGIRMSARDGAFTVRDPSARVAFGKVRVRSAVRVMVDAVDVVVNTDRARLTEKERADCDKVQRIGSMAQAAALAEARRRPTPQLRAVGEAASA